MPKADDTTFLAHPIYLDEDMMLSFLAHLDGGVTLVEEQQDTTSASSVAAATLRAAIKAKLAVFASAELSAQGSYKSESGDSQQVKRSKQHTAASLFNLLYEYLKADEAIARPDDSEAARVKPGQLIEIEGAYLGNPLEDVMQLLGSLLPYIVPEPAATPTPPKANAKSGNPAARTASPPQAKPEPTADQATAAMIRRMIADSEASPVHDLLLKTPSGLNAVVVASSEYFRPATNEMLRSGTVKVLGKVTWVLTEDDAINLMRRTVFGVAGDQMSNSLLDDFRTALPLTQIAEPIVKYPALQIIPMAIFV
jgi:hypothetical protein